MDERDDDGQRAGAIWRTALAAVAAAVSFGPVAAPVAAGSGTCAIPTEAVPAASRRARLADALCDGFGIQYWGEDYDADTLGAAPHGLLILELTLGGPSDAEGEVRFSPKEIARISRGGARPVLGYLNVGEIESYRDYHLGGEAPPAGWSGGESPEGERLAAYWAAPWREVLMRRVDDLMATGIDGLFLDDALHYYTQGTTSPDAPAPGRPEGHAAHAAAMMALIEAIAVRARAGRCDALVIVNNAAFIGRDAGAEHVDAFEAYRAAIDGVLVEDAMGDGRHPDTIVALADDFMAEGLAVLTVDVTVDEGSRIAARSVRRGFTPYVARDDGFNRLFAPSLECRRPEREIREAAR